jgi:hypothetical protein
MIAMGCGGKTLAANDGGASSANVVPPVVTGGAGPAGGESGPMAPSGSGGGAIAPSPVSQAPGTGTCSDYLDSGLNLTCMGGDCPPGQACCGCYAFSGGLSTASACAPAPCASGFQLCVSDAECSMGTCTTLPVVTTVKLCAPVADAGAAPIVDSGNEGGAADAQSQDASVP